MKNAPSRRSILHAGTCGLALIVLSPKLAGAIENRFSARPDLASRLARLVVGPEHSAGIGATLGCAREPAEILEDLANAWGESINSLENATDVRLVRTVLKHHAQDLNNGNFVVVNGWILSKTEAGIYELAALASVAS
jgi:hypothetical protein